MGVICIPRSEWRVPHSQVWMGVHHLRSGQGVPHSQVRMVVPHSQVRMGVPHPMSGWGYPIPISGQVVPHPRSGLGTPIPGPDGDWDIPSQVQMRGTPGYPPSRSGPRSGSGQYPLQDWMLDWVLSPSPSRIGWSTPPPLLPHRETEQHSEHLLRGGWCASCVHVGGLSSYFQSFEKH